MAEEDAERERNHQETLLKVRMTVDAACMHDTELIDNCFFSSRQKVTAQAQTVPKELVDRAMSIMTPFSQSSNFGKKGPVTERSERDINLASHKVRGNGRLDSDLDENTPRDLMNSDRELIDNPEDRKADLVGLRDGAASGDEMINDVLEGIDSDNGHIRHVLKEKGARGTRDSDGGTYLIEAPPVRPKDPNCRETPRARG